MSSTHTFLLLCAAFALANCGNSIEKSSVSTSTRCGNEILFATSGNITYKVGEPLQPNERCVWLIRVDNATGYSVGVFALGFSGPAKDSKLTITQFNATGVPQNIWADHIGLYNVSMSNALVVTLHTGSSANISDFTGFSLEYHAQFGGDSPVSQSRYADYFADNRKDDAWLGTSGSEDGSPTLQFMFFTWGTNTVNPQEHFKVLYKRENLWTADDALEMYWYNSNYEWTLYTVLSNDDYYRVWEFVDMKFLAYRNIRSAGNATRLNYLVANFFVEDCIVQKEAQLNS